MSRRGAARPAPRMPAATSGLAPQVQSLTGGAPQVATPAPEKSPAVKVALLQPNPENPRPTELEVDDMVTSLQLQGQLQNINVMSRERFIEVKPYLAQELNDRPYVVINGRRRMEAAPRAGLNELRHRVRDDWDAADIDRAVISENEDREAVNPLHLGRFLKRMEANFPSQRKLAAHLGKSSAWVSQRIAMTNLHDDLQKAIEAGKVPFVLARECVRLAPELQTELAAGKLPVDVAQAWVVTLRIKPDEQLARFKAGPPYDIEPTPPPTKQPAAQEPTPAQDDPQGKIEPAGDSTSRPIIIRIAERSPTALAGALRKEFTPEEIAELVQALTDDQ